MTEKINFNPIPEKGFGLNKPIQRRSFLMLTGAMAISGVVLSSCSKNDNSVSPSTTNNGVNLGSGDIGILNYAYALEQLEAAFYTQVVATPYSGISSSEMQLLTDIKGHEVAHRDFFKAALGASAIGGLSVNFTSINFKDRASVLATAMAFEDLGVSAYNGAGQLLQSTDYLLLAGKIVSVEARHAAAIRDLLSPKSASFAGDDDVDSNGLDMERSPSAVLAIAGTYVSTKIDASNLPK